MPFHPDFAYRLPDRFHDDERFEYERFYNSVLSYTEPLVQGATLRITTVFVYQDELSGEYYGQYRFSENSETLKAFPHMQKYLKEFKIPLGKEEHQEFSIQKMFWDFYQQNEIEIVEETTNPDDQQEGPLVEVSIPKYFSQVQKRKDHYFDTHGATYTDENYEQKKEVKLEAEELLVQALLDKEGLNWTTSKFLPFPIISAGHLRGMVYFLYDSEKVRKKEETSLISKYESLVLAITREYENVLLAQKSQTFARRPEEPLEDFQHIFLEFGIAYKFPDLITLRDMEQAGQGKRWKVAGHPFLEQIGYNKYYNRISHVLIIQGNNTNKSNKAQVRNAITSIIVDSFAHNVGAHSLLGLKWWIENRAMLLRERFMIKNTQVRLKNLNKVDDGVLLEAILKLRNFYNYIDAFEKDSDDGEISILDLIRFLPSEEQREMMVLVDKNAAPGTERKLGQIPLPIDHALYHFFEYLRDKSAFWSGVTRDTVFSGEVKGWDTLLREFINNSLFLGTITNTEGINRVNIHVEYLVDGVVEIGGHFAEINLDIVQKEQLGYVPPKKAKKKQKGAIEYSDYAFLRKGTDYQALIKKLASLKPVFLPNGVIGQQALYTILENTLRNIKHYRHRLKEIQESGVQLYLSIEEFPFSGRGWQESDLKNLYRVGAWLHHEQDLLVSKKKEPESAVLYTHTQQLKSRVVDRHGLAKLGGSSQDKVCAAMLMNNYFFSIDEMDLDMVKRQYFPYIYSGTEDWSAAVKNRGKGFKPKDQTLHPAKEQYLREAKDSFERQKRRTEMIDTYVKDRLAKPKATGLIKKFFHVWKGRPVLVVDKQFDRRMENLSRFQIIAVDKYQSRDEKGDLVEYRFDHPDIKMRPLWPLRKQGVIRVVKATQEMLKAEQVPASDKSEAKKIQFELAMVDWLKGWLDYRGQPIGVRLQRPEGTDFDGARQFNTFGAAYLCTRAGKLVCEYANEDELDDYIEESGHPLTKDLIDQFQSIKFQHANQAKEVEEITRFRNHCSLKNDIFRDYIFSSAGKINGNRIEEAKLEFPECARLLETLSTKICMFDARLFKRLPKRKKGVYDPFREQLRLDVFSEEKKDFDRYKKQLVSKKQLSAHFLILHLSFLESIKYKKKGRSYQEKEVEDFFYNEIVQPYQKKHRKQGQKAAEVKFPANFVMVITSGRGRGDWFKAIDHPQITFRPIESLTNAVEDGLSMKDDFQVKYNLCNVLFGS